MEKMLKCLIQKENIYVFNKKKIFANKKKENIEVYNRMKIFMYYNKKIYLNVWCKEISKCFIGKQNVITNIIFIILLEIYSSSII